MTATTQLPAQPAADNGERLTDPQPVAYKHSHDTTRPWAAEAVALNDALDAACEAVQGVIDRREVDHLVNAKLVAENDVLWHHLLWHHNDPKGYETAKAGWDRARLVLAEAQRALDAAPARQ